MTTLIKIFHSTIQGLDKSRRINQTLATTGTAVVKTKEVVGKFSVSFIFINLNLEASGAIEQHCWVDPSVTIST